VLIDTSTLLRTLQPSHPQREMARVAIKALTARGRDLHIVPQNLVEPWVVATRPVAQNGLGLSTTEAAAELLRLKSMFLLLPDTPAIYPVWESLVIQYRVSGNPRTMPGWSPPCKCMASPPSSPSTEPDSPATPASRFCIPPMPRLEQANFGVS
jgi:hypothetical protein